MPNAPNAPSNQMQPFDYDPSQYVTTAGNWANGFYNNNTQQYQWANDQFNKNAATSDTVTSAALNNANMFDNAAAAGVSRYQSMYAPAMQQQLAFAQGWATPENLAFLRGQAIGSVGQAFDQSADAAATALRSAGLDPATIGARLDIPVRTQRAASEAAAGTSSDVNNRLLGQQMLGQAIQTGQTDAGITTQNASTGAANRNQAVNTGLATTASGSSTMGTPLQWSGLGATELQQWPAAEQASYSMNNAQGQLWNSINQTNLAAQAQNYNQGSGTGALLGAGLGLAGTIAGSYFGGPIGGAVLGSIGSKIGGSIGGSSGGGNGMMGQPAGQIGFGSGSGSTYAHGGAINTGQVVPHHAQVPGISGPDKVPAMVQAGEGILPKRTMDHIGKKGLQAIIDKADKEMGNGSQPPAGGQSKPTPRQAMQTGPTFASAGAMG